MLLNNRRFDYCDEIKEVNEDGTVVTTKYVLYRKDGTEVVMGVNTKKLADIEAKIADLEAEKAVMVSLKETK